MTQKKIKMAGKTYPVVFTLKTMMNFEEITGKSFFNENFETMKSRIALGNDAPLLATRMETRLPWRPT